MNQMDGSRPGQASGGPKIDREKTSSKPSTADPSKPSSRGTRLSTQADHRKADEEGDPTGANPTQGQHEAISRQAAWFNESQTEMNKLKGFNGAADKADSEACYEACLSLLQKIQHKNKQSTITKLPSGRKKSGRQRKLVVKPREGLIAINLACNFMVQKIWPLKDRAHPAWEYQFCGNDPTQESLIPINKYRATNRIYDFFKPGTVIITNNCPNTLHYKVQRPPKIIERSKMKSEALKLVFGRVRKICQV
ncbi:hypothetical protein OsI_35879 [Oryza sativa Indica Group]|uniref:Uncharacterized protein n=1 Tax=Oryza sativa subsp. indica TaxID=39946 RepID=B8BK59_ORYSI|nr:hypothetical protein OsI_35879 [Oryza sativa Indica Group]